MFFHNLNALSTTVYTLFIPHFKFIYLKESLLKLQFFTKNLTIPLLSLRWRTKHRIIYEAFRISLKPML